jgi:hypothetical protein
LNQENTMSPLAVANLKGKSKRKPRRKAVMLDDAHAAQRGVDSEIYSIPETSAATKMSVPWVWQNLALFEVVCLGRRKFVTKRSVRKLIASRIQPAV